MKVNGRHAAENDYLQKQLHWLVRCGRAEKHVMYESALKEINIVEFFIYTSKLSRTSDPLYVNEVSSA